MGMMRILGRAESTVDNQTVSVDAGVGSSALVVNVDKNNDTKRDSRGSIIGGTADDISISVTSDGAIYKKEGYGKFSKEELKGMGVDTDELLKIRENLLSQGKLGDDEMKALSNAAKKVEQAEGISR